MNEFSLIDDFFKRQASLRDDVIFGIGDDAACVRVPLRHDVLISTDTLVAGVHFLNEWDPFDIAYRAVMVNVSDMAAMAATPCWVSLALTIPEFDEAWMTRFSEGFHQALNRFGLSLIGGDTTRGPLCITLTIHGAAPQDSSVQRRGASSGDIILVSGPLGAAALAVSLLKDATTPQDEMKLLMDKLLHPMPRVDLAFLLRRYATACIDISDGLSQDLHHICKASGLSAHLVTKDIPIHPLVRQIAKEKALSLALGGGDDYELCFTVSPSNLPNLLTELDELGLTCYAIGVMRSGDGMFLEDETGNVSAFTPKGYSHF